MSITLSRSNQSITGDGSSGLYLTLESRWASWFFSSIDKCRRRFVRWSARAGAAVVSPLFEDSSHDGFCDQCTRSYFVSIIVWLAISYNFNRRSIGRRWNSNDDISKILPIYFYITTFYVFDSMPIKRGVWKRCWNKLLYSPILALSAVTIHTNIIMR